MFTPAIRPLYQRRGICLDDFAACRIFGGSWNMRHGGPIHELTEVNAAELISDLCVFLGLSDQNRRKVLGARAATHLDQTLDRARPRQCSNTESGSIRKDATHKGETHER